MYLCDRMTEYFFTLNRLTIMAKMKGLFHFIQSFFRRSIVVSLLQTSIRLKKEAPTRKFDDRFKSALSCSLNRFNGRLIKRDLLRLVDLGTYLINILEVFFSALRKIL